MAFALDKRCERYYEVVPTIQVRGIPDDVHRKYQLRAAEAGMSLQEYLRVELTRNADLTTPAELVAEVDRRLRVEGGESFATKSSSDIVRADRESH